MRYFCPFLLFDLNIKLSPDEAMGMVSFTVPYFMA